MMLLIIRNGCRSGADGLLRADALHHAHQLQSDERHPRSPRPQNVPRRAAPPTLASFGIVCFCFRNIVMGIGMSSAPPDMLISMPLAPPDMPMPGTVTGMSPWLRFTACGAMPGENGKK